jgi:hypothetical protein
MPVFQVGCHRVARGLARGHLIEHHRSRHAGELGNAQGGCARAQIETWKGGRERALETRARRLRHGLGARIRRRVDDDRSNCPRASVSTRRNSFMVAMTTAGQDLPFGGKPASCRSYTSRKRSAAGPRRPARRAAYAASAGGKVHADGGLADAALATDHSDGAHWLPKRYRK